MSAHHDDVDLTPDENLRIEALTIAENPDLAPVPVVEEQPPAKQDGVAQFAVAAVWALWALSLLALVILDAAGGHP